MNAILAFAAGLVLLIVGAELLTRGGTRLASMLGISPLVIGLTVVAIGTSMPELAIGVEAALAGAGELAIGNIAGTNTLNVLLILGLIAAIRPLRLELTTLRYDLPSMVTAAVLFLLFALDGILLRWEGIVLVALAVIYTVMIVRVSRRESLAVRREYAREFGDRAEPVVIVVGADWLVDGASEIARLIGASEAFIGLTIVAIGTSAPELVTALVSTLRGDRRIAVGNLIGSSTYNILLILGVTAIVPEGGIAMSPLLSFVDIPVMVAAALVCIPIFVSSQRISRVEGALMVTGYLTYLTYLLSARI